MTDIAISVKNLSKCFHIYESPRDRLKQFVLPRLQRFAGKQPIQYYREFWALKDVSVEIKKGETVGIIGRNGSGKSTLLQIICGTLTPTSGSVQTNGRIAALLELGSGFNPEFTGRENVYMNAAVLGLRKDEIDTRFDDIVAFADIGDFIDQPVKTYSSGMMVRLAFAVAINVDPEILIVDEALSVGDELFQRKCFSRIEAIRESGATILFVSHSGGQIVELCDHALLIDSGEKLVFGLPKKIVGHYQKLLYAPQDKRNAIRDEIRISSDNSRQSLVATHISQTGSLISENDYIDGNEVKELFDPNLKPQSTLVYESLGAYIESPQILTLSGENVNFLQRGKRYRYTYSVKFNQGFSNVRFGMLIKTTSGIELGGAMSAASPTEGIEYQAPGTIVNIEFKFTCNLNPGAYFLNAGVMGTHQGGETFLHRVLDICMFKVMPISNDVTTAIIDFGCEAVVNQVGYTFREVVTE